MDGLPKRARSVRVLGKADRNGTHRSTSAPVRGDGVERNQVEGDAGVGRDAVRGTTPNNRITPEEVAAQACPRCGWRSFQNYRLIPDAPACGCMKCGFVFYLTARLP